MGYIYNIKGENICIPALQSPEQPAVCRPVADPYVPERHAVDELEPDTQYEPKVHKPEQAAVCRPVTDPYVPGGHGVGAFAYKGQYELTW